MFVALVANIRVQAPQDIDSEKVDCFRWSHGGREQLLSVCRESGLVNLHSLLGDGINVNSSGWHGFAKVDEAEGTMDVSLHHLGDNGGHLVRVHLVRLPAGVYVDQFRVVRPLNLELLNQWQGPTVRAFMWIDGGRSHLLLGDIVRKQVNFISDGNGSLMESGWHGSFEFLPLEAMHLRLHWRGLPDKLRSHTLRYVVETGNYCDHYRAVRPLLLRARSERASAPLCL